MARIAALTYGVVCYAIFFATFLGLVGFLAGYGVPRPIDAGQAGSLAAAVVANTVLVLLFALQHSVMARPGFKDAFTRVVPQPVERSTYVLASSVALLALMALWQPMPGVVWALHGTAATAMTALFLGGVCLVLYATFLIDHFDLFGLRQVWLYFRGRPYEQKRFATPSLYRHVRHPLYIGWFATVWCTPTMTAGHLFFAATMTAYVLVAIVYEERDLLRFLGDDYRRWREATPMFVPRLHRRTAHARVAASTSRASTR